MKDQTVRCWGSNTSGQVGDGTYSSASNPVPVTGLAGITQLAVGRDHRCALLNSGAVRCWGEGEFGQLGNGQLYTTSSTPVPVTGVSDAVQLAAGYQHTCALLKNTTVTCWGWNGTGQIVGGSGNVATPVGQSLSRITQVVGTAYGTCAIQATTVQCWGMMLRGGNAKLRQMSNLPSIAQLSAGQSHVCALSNAGTVYCWGENDFGQLGASEPATTEAPIQILGLTDVARLVSGSTHTCAQLKDNSVKCWGGGYGASPTVVFDP
ncbi:MAG TPA: hypothetical protein VFQ61_10545 [Polyangiaceae bacterium]|nr:hypothetical protein [Polyangiaceae bacterium]